MDRIMRETLCGFVEDVYDQIESGRAGRRGLMAAAERLAGAPDVPKTRAASIYRFMVENGITLNAAAESQEESRRFTALAHAERREHETLKYMRALDRDLGDCVRCIRADRTLMRHVSANTRGAVSSALHCLRADNLYICGGRREPRGTGPLAEMEDLHAENVAALGAFAVDDHLPEMLSDATKHAMFFVTQMVNANRLLVRMGAEGLLADA